MKRSPKIEGAKPASHFTMRVPVDFKRHLDAIARQLNETEGARLTNAAIILRLVEREAGALAKGKDEPDASKCPAGFLIVKTCEHRSPEDTKITLLRIEGINSVRPVKNLPEATEVRMTDGAHFVVTENFSSLANRLGKTKPAKVK